MKRNSSDIPSSPISSASDTDVKPGISFPPLSFKTAQTTPDTPSPNKKQKAIHAEKSNESQAGVWNGEKNALMMETIIAAGFKVVDLDSLADKVSFWIMMVLSDDKLISSKLGVSKQQIHTQLRAGKKGNVREKVVQALRAERSERS